MQGHRWQAQIGHAVQKIQRAAETYNPNGQLFWYMVEDALETLARDIDGTLTSEHINEMVRVTEQSSENMLRAGLAGIELAQRKEGAS